MICDRDAVIASAGVPKKEYTDRKISAGVEKYMENRQLYTCVDGNESPLYLTDGDMGAIRCLMPILSEGDIIGCVASIAAREEECSAPTDLEIKLIQTAAHFLGKQLDA